MTRKKDLEMTFAPTQFYTTNTEPVRVFQAVRDTLFLHPDLLDASPDQLASCLGLKPAAFEVEVALEALAVEGTVLA
jgi:hypothetical protein